ncbi:MAG: hypothetical protein SV186_01340 [Candidatus Nanohaloarchaea archaeon]|nr:hypothetical protein [Candidatus Nanohaloarchaea archaeon]
MTLSSFDPSKLGSLVLVLLLLTMSAGTVAAAEGSDSGSDSGSNNGGALFGSEAITDTFNRLFVPENKQDELSVDSFPRFLYFVLLPFALVTIMIFLGVEGADVASGNTAAVIALILGLILIPSGVYQTIGGKIIAAATLENGEISLNLLTIIGNMGSSLLLMAIGFAIFEIGLTAGSFGGLMIAFVGLFILFSSLSGLGFLGEQTRDLARGVAGGSVFMIVIISVLGYLFFRMLTHGRHRGHHI